MILKRKILVYCVLISVILFVYALDVRIITRKYKIYTDKIKNTVRLALITDLHSCYYGENQKRLINEIDEQNPNIILFGGDIIDDELEQKNAWIAIKALASKYRCYYVSGNHELCNEKIDDIKQKLLGLGIVVLEGECKIVDISGQMINISGVDDVSVGKNEFLLQIENAGHRDNKLFSLFISHRPEYIEIYKKYEYDLILSGHAHGGQWRLPLILNGLYAPNQGLFPKYAGGEYKLGASTFIVSRGLARESTRVPRIFNRPEVVIAEINP